MTTPMMCIVGPATQPVPWSVAYERLVDYLGRPPTWDWSGLVLTGGRLRAMLHDDYDPEELGCLPLRVEAPSLALLAQAIGAWPEARWSYRQRGTPRLWLTLPSGAHLCCSLDRHPVAHYAYPTHPEETAPPHLTPPESYHLPQGCGPSEVADVMGSGIRYSYRQGLQVRGRVPIPAPLGTWSTAEWAAAEWEEYGPLPPTTPEWAEWRAMLGVE